MAMKAPEVSKRTPIGRGPPSGSNATSASYKCRGSPGRPKTYGTPSAFMARTTASHPVNVGMAPPNTNYDQQRLSVLPSTPEVQEVQEVRSVRPSRPQLCSGHRPHQRRVWQQRCGEFRLAGAAHKQAQPRREQTEHSAPDES